MSTLKNQESVPENELTQLRKQIVQKDMSYSMLENQLLKKNEELTVAQKALDDTFHKLRNEADRVLKLETDLNRCSEDLRSERLTRQNLESSFASASEKLKSEELASKHLQLELENYASRTAVQHETELTRLRDEKTTLESRVRSLESHLHANKPSQPPTRLPRPTTFPGTVTDASEVCITTLESQLLRAERELADKSRALLSAQQDAAKVPRLQSDLIAAQNAQMRAERAAKAGKANAEHTQEALKEREEELEYWRTRAEERSAIDSKLEDALQERDRAVQREEEARQRENMLRQKMEYMEEKEAELVMEKEEALSALHQFQIESHSPLIPEDTSIVPDLGAALAERDTALTKARKYNNELQQMYHDTLSACKDAEARAHSLELQLQRPDAPLIIVSPPPLPSPAPSFLVHPAPPSVAANPDLMSLTNDAIVTRLLTAIDRLRGERDTLRRDLHFARIEHQIAADTLQAKLKAAESELCKAAVVSRSASELETMTLELKEELESSRHVSESLHAELSHRVGELEACSKELESERLRLEDLEGNGEKLSASRASEARVAVASLVVAQHLWSKLEEIDASTGSLGHVHDELKETQLKLSQANEASSLLLEITQARDASLAAQETLRKDLAASDARLAEALKSAADRDIQLSEVQFVASTLQRELSDARHAEARRNERQLAKLSPAVAEALKLQLAELEQRVLRRTEQIGMQQHDIKRLETNLRVAEDTIGELSAELETLNHEKACLIEDCAQAREARDGAYRKVDDLEIEVEAFIQERDDLRKIERMFHHSQAEVIASEERIEALVRVVVDSATHSKDLSSKLAITKARLSTIEADLCAATGNYSTAQAEIKRITLELDSKVSLLDASVASVEALTKELVVSKDETYQLSTAFECFRDEVRSREQATFGQSEDLIATIEELEGRLAAAQASEGALSQELSTVRQQEIRLQAQVREAQEEHRAITAKAEKLASDIISLEEVLKAEESSHLESLAQTQQTLEGRITELEAQIEEGRTRFSTLEETHAGIAEKYSAENKELQSRLERVQADVAMQNTLEADLRRLKAEYANEALILRSQLNESFGQIDSLKVQLQTTTETIDEYEAELESYAQRYETAQVENRALEHALLSTRAQLDEHDGSIQALQREKNLLQREHTQLEAELERATTKYQYMEQQAKRSDHELARLKAEVEHLRAEAAKFDEAAQTAETSLNIKTVQFEQKLAMMQREIKKQQEHRHCQENIAEYQEKTEYLEEMLRMKSVEIEENDDRFIEALKEKKRLNSKIESLTRKVQSLQTKLATLISASTNPSPTTPAAPSIAPRKTPSLSLPPVPSGASGIRPPTRIPSSPAVALRAKTPDSFQRAFVSRFTTPEPPVPSLPQVPQIKTPEPTRALRNAQTNGRIPSVSDVAVPSTPSTPLSSGNRKRRAPDDFDSPVSLPPQAIVAPSGNLTPRHSRRSSNHTRSKFTPTRNGTAAPGARANLQVSPLRRMAAPLAESTNSPRGNRAVSSEKPIIVSKPPVRSWLNKTRAPTPGARIDTQNTNVLGVQP